MSSAGITRLQGHQTENQIAFSATRRSHSSGSSQSHPQEDCLILTREWVHTRQSSNEGKGILRVMTWNMLAQCLVRRDLFPSSDCLKASQREGMLIDELLRYNADIICLQEVDRLEKLLPSLHNGSFTELYAAGPSKRHGCMIVYRDSLFKKAGHVVIRYDELDVRQTGDERQRRGSSRRTKNIGLIVGLRQRDQPDCGCIVVTTHLFWDPSFTYERIRLVLFFVVVLSVTLGYRQAALLLQEVNRFQEAHGLQDWPCIIAGDFNITPTDAAYSFLVGNKLTSQQLKDIEASRVIHTSIDSSIASTPAVPDDQKCNTAEHDLDRIVTNTRMANIEDGLLSDEELHSLFNSYGPLRSVYDEAQRSVISEHDNVSGARLCDMTPVQKGFYEPMWTSYTHFWKTTLDYIFLLPHSGPKPHVLGILKTHRTFSLGAGLPLKGVCGSDHISLAAEIENVVQCDTD